jgi:uncharacterized protein YcfL
MKKVMILFAASLIFAACGGSAEQATQDSTVVADSSAVVDSANVVTDSAQLKDAVTTGASTSEIPVK